MTLQTPVEDHERAAAGKLSGAAREEIRELMLAGRDTGSTLRGIWAMHVTGGIAFEDIGQLVQSGDEQARGWAIQAATEAAPYRTAGALGEGAAGGPLDGRLRDVAEQGRRPRPRRWPWRTRGRRWRPGTRSRSARCARWQSWRQAGSSPTSARNTVAKVVQKRATIYDWLWNRS